MFGLYMRRLSNKMRWSSNCTRIQETALPSGPALGRDNTMVTVFTEHKN